jgi:hypothetical protein
MAVQNVLAPRQRSQDNAKSRRPHHNAMMLFAMSGKTCHGTAGEYWY